MAKCCALITLLFTLSPYAPLVGSPAPYQSAGRGGSTRLNGIYRAPAKDGANSTSSLDIIDPAKKTPGYKFLTFFQDGRVKKGLPVRGLDTVDSESDMRRDLSSGGNTAGQWGMYQIAGGRGRIVFADGRLGGQQIVSGLRGEVWQIAIAADGLEIQGDTYVRLFGGNAMHLEGVYKPFGDPKARGITFSKDGEFIDEGILNTGGSIAVGAFVINSPGPGRGTYNIVRYGLHLNYANGQAPESLFFPEAGEATDNVQVLYIDNVKYQQVPAQKAGATTGPAEHASAAAPANSPAGVATISVSSNPDGADVYLDGDFVGNAPATLKLTAGKHTIKVTKAGFQDWSRDLTAQAGSEARLAANLTKAN